MRKSESRVVMSEIFNELDLFLTEHFQTEENLFDSLPYSAAAGHKEEHRNFTRKVHRFKAEFEEEKIGLAVDVMNFMCDWVVNHIKNIDREYADIFTGQRPGGYLGGPADTWNH